MKAIRKLGFAYTISAYLSQTNRVCSSLTRQLEAVIIELSSGSILFQVLKSQKVF